MYITCSIWIKHFILQYNVQEQTKDTTFEKFSEQVVQGWKSQYNVPRSWFWETNGIWPCCRLYQVKAWGSVQDNCNQTAWPYRCQQLELLWEYCDICLKHNRSTIAYYHHHDLSHFGLICWICALCREPYVSKEMLPFHVTCAHGGPDLFQWEVAQRCVVQSK